MTAGRVETAVQCAICLEDFCASDDKDVCEVACSGKHIFHVACITDWARGGNTSCPLCREEIC